MGGEAHIKFFGKYNKIKWLNLLITIYKQYYRTTKQLNHKSYTCERNNKYYGFTPISEYFITSIYIYKNLINNNIQENLISLFNWKISSKNKIFTDDICKYIESFLDFKDHVFYKINCGSYSLCLNTNMNKSYSRLHARSDLHFNTRVFDISDKIKNKFPDNIDIYLADGRTGYDYGDDSYSEHRGYDTITNWGCCYDDY